MRKRSTSWLPLFLFLHLYLYSILSNWTRPNLTSCSLSNYIRSKTFMWTFSNYSLISHPHHKPDFCPFSLFERNILFPSPSWPTTTTISLTFNHKKSFLNTHSHLKLHRTSFDLYHTTEVDTVKVTTDFHTIKALTVFPVTKTIFSVLILFFTAISK